MMKAWQAWFSDVLNFRISFSVAFTFFPPEVNERRKCHTKRKSNESFLGILRTSTLTGDLHYIKKPRIGEALVFISN